MTASPKVSYPGQAVASANERMATSSSGRVVQCKVPPTLLLIGWNCGDLFADWWIQAM